MSFSLSGLASGLDTNTIIAQLMQLERIPYNKMEQKKTTINTELSLFRSINTKLSTLRTAAEDLVLKSNFNLRSATNTNENVVKATVSEETAETSYTINVSKLATQHSVKTAEFSDEDLNMTVQDWLAANGLAGEAFKITVNGQDFEAEYTSETTLEDALTDISSKINSSDLKVSASLISTNSVTGKKTLVLNSNDYGTAGALDFTGTSSLLVQKLEIEDAVSAQDAELTINGLKIISSSNQINDVLPGLSVTLMQIGDTTINVTKDNDKIAEKIEAFVNAYNDVINTIRSNTGQQKALQGDATLRSLENQLNRILNLEVEGNDKFKYLFEIGLEVDKGITSGSLMNGTISFDKEKFLEALSESPEDVFNLFAFRDEENEKYGIGQAFRNTIMEWTRIGSGILASRIDGYNNELSFLSKRMDDMNVRLEMKENQLKRQFTAMESALIQLQNQQSWMASQIASLSLGNY